VPPLFGNGGSDWRWDVSVDNWFGAGKGVAVTGGEIGYAPLNGPSRVSLSWLMVPPLVGDGRLGGRWDVPGDGRLNVAESITVTGGMVVNVPVFGVWVG
jgi:hypothetical protein